MSPNHTFLARLQSALQNHLHCLVGNDQLPEGVRQISVRSNNGPGAYITYVYGEHEKDQATRTVIEFDERPSVTGKSTRIDFRVTFLQRHQMLSEGRWQHHTFSMGTHQPEICAGALAQSIIEHLRGQVVEHATLRARLVNAR